MSSITFALILLSLRIVALHESGTRKALFKEHVQFFNRLYDITWFVAAYSYRVKCSKPKIEHIPYTFRNLIHCSVGNYNKLDQLQLEAARIVTGLPIFASSILIYKELGWESLTERRKGRKLQMFYKIQNNNAPGYLCDLIPPVCVMEVI